MNLRRTKRKLRANKKVLFIALGIILGVIILTLVISNLPKSTPIEKNKQQYDILTVDVLAMKDIRGDQVSVKGVKLGDAQQAVLDKIGYPDAQTAYPPDLTNMEFGKAFSLNQTGMILQFTGDKLTQISVTPEFNNLLLGETKVLLNETQILQRYGTPDLIERIPASPTSPILLRMYTYKQGLKFTIRRDQQIALSFIMPRIKKTTTVSSPQN